MKKSICVIAAAMLFMTAAVTNLRAQSFEQGNILISGGYGFGNFAKALFKAAEGAPGYQFKSFGPVFVKGEYAASDNVGIGINFAYLGMNSQLDYYMPDPNDPVDSIQYHAEVGLNSYSVLGRVNFHFANGDMIDPYFGLGVGYRGGSWSFSDTDPNGDYTGIDNAKVMPFGFETTLGLRFYVIDMLGIYSEVGLAKGIVQVGLTYKIGGSGGN
jgi:opacity protein-like surface antigen